MTPPKKEEYLGASPGGRGPRRVDFHVDFANLLDKYISKPGSLVIVEDFNIHWDNDCPEQKELKIFWNPQI